MAIRYLIPFLLFATSAIGQEWPFLPIIGGSAYSCGQTNGDSTCTIPAGPPSVTGVETIPVDTNLSGGEEPQQAKVTVDTLKSYIFNGLRIGTTPITNGSGSTNCLYDNSGILGEKSCLASLINGTTTITGATNGNCLYNNSGVLGNKGCLTSLVVSSTVVSGATNGNCLYNNAGILGDKSCVTSLTVGTTAIGSGTNGYCLYNNSGILGNQICGFTSGAATSGCAMGALVYTDPTTATIQCDSATSVTNGFFGLIITAAGFTGIQGIFGNVHTGAIISTGLTPDFTAGTCAVSGATGSVISGKFSANGACAGGTIILTTTITATTGYSCVLNNQTSASRAIRQTAVSTTTATFTATLNDMDVINYICLGY